MSDKLTDIRALFPHTNNTTYLNHAAIGAISTPVKNALDSYLYERHLTHIENFFDVMPVIDETRERVGKMLGCEAVDVAFTANTSSGLNILTLGLDWQAGDRIAVPACEFPANVYPFMNLKRLGVEVDFIPEHEGTFTIEDIERTLTPKTRLLSISWVQFLSGFKADLKAIGQICEDRGILFCVDAIQGLGALKLPGTMAELKIDFLASGTHKWLMGVLGSGFVYVSPDLFTQLIPAMAGWLHGYVDWENLSDYKLDFHPDGRRFELGVPNHLGLIALHASLGLYLDTGREWCNDQVLKNANQIRSALKAANYPIYGESPDENQSGIVTIRHPKPEETYDKLQKAGIECAIRNRLIRFAPSWYNSEEEIAKAISIL